MNRRFMILAMLLLTALLLSGCAMGTVEDMYALPKRSEEYSQLQTAIDGSMVGLEYSAPINGENQQSVQTVDLDGDGVEEYLVFAAGNWENPLQVLIFQQREDGSCVLIDTIKGNGTAFEQVEYVTFDDKPGKEILIGYRVSDQVMRSVSVYSLKGNSIQQLLLVGYTRFLTCDFDGDGRFTLMVLRPGETETDPGVAVLYAQQGDRIQRSEEITLSIPAAQIERVQLGKMTGGKDAVYVSSSQLDEEVVTDVLTIEKGQLQMPATAAEAAYSYPEDIDGDGIVEIPGPMKIRPVTVWKNDADHCLLRWFAVDDKGIQLDKLFTFHNFRQGWYLRLSSSWENGLSVVEGEGVYTFYMWNEDASGAGALFSIYTHTGSNRNEAAGEEGQFLLHSTETAVYAGKLEAEAVRYGVTREMITEAFGPIRPGRPGNMRG